MINDNNRTMKRFLGILFIALISCAAQAQNDAKYGETEEQQIKCKQALSVYKSFLKQKNYEDAYPGWIEACEVCPKAVSQSLYSDGARLLKKELKKSEGIRKAALADSLMAVYDTRIELFPTTSRSPNNRCKILGYKAGDMYKYFPEKLAEANAIFKESMDCLENKTAASTLSGYYLTSYKLLQAAEGDAADETLAMMLTEYLTLQSISDYNISNQTKESTVEGYKKAKANIDEIFVLIANCEKMVPIFESKIAANPEDMDLKIKALKLMNGKDCTESDFYLSLAEDVHKADPTHESAYAVGMGYLKKEQYGKALSYFEQAVELCADCPDLEKYLLRAGQVASVLKQTSKARSYANKVLKINPQSGDAYLLIGDAIATGAKQCKDAGIGERAVYWLAVDYYYKAKNMDSGIASKAQKKINSYSGQFPTKEDLFTFGIAEGSTFTICTGESTKVRAR